MLNGLVDNTGTDGKWGSTYFNLTTGLRIQVLAAIAKKDMSQGYVT